jgi:hypothetical protein
MTARAARVALAAWILLLPLRAWGAGDQNSRLFGRVVDGVSGAPLPDATVRVEGAALIGPPRTTTTAGDGSYQLGALPPGHYRVTVGYPGARTTERRVAIRLGEPTQLEIRWTPELAGEEATVIVESRRLTRPGDAQTGTVLSADEEAKLATARTPLDIAQQVVGVGNQNDPRYGNPEIKGGTYLNNHYLVDGFDVTDPVSQLLSADFNFDSIAHLQVLTGGMEAQYNSLGGVINLVTSAGSDQFHADTGLYVNPQAFSSNRAYGTSIFNDREPFSQSMLRNQSYQAYLNISGPLIRHKLWGSLGVQYDDQTLAGVPAAPLFVVPPSQSERRGLLRGKLTFAPSAPHRLTISFNADPDFVQNSDQVNGLANTAGAKKRGSVIAIARYDYLPRESRQLTVQAGYEYRESLFGPQGRLYSGPDSYDYNRPAHTNQDDGTVWYNSPYPATRDRRHTAQLDPSLSLRGRWLGLHDAKIGLQTRFAWNPYESEVPGGVSYLDSGGGPAEAGVCDERTGHGCYLRSSQAPYATRTWGVSAGLFVQDRWQVTPRVTLLPGLRLDWGITRNTVDETVSNLFAVGPRLGLAIDVTGDGKTIFSAYYGRANEVLPILEAGYADVQALQTTERWDSKSGAFVPQSVSGGRDGYRIDPRVTAPHTDEITLSLRRELFAGLAGIDYTFKRISNIWDQVEVNQIWDPTGTRVVGYANGRPTQIHQFSTLDESYRIYHGVDVYAEARPTPAWDLYAGYTFAWLYGPGAEQVGQISGYDQYSAFYNPRQTIFHDGYLPEDIRHHVKARVSYTWRGLSAGIVLDFHTGAPQTKRFFQRQDGDYFNQRSPQGTEPGVGNDPRAITELRLPAVLQLNLRVSWDLEPILHQHVILIGDFFNLFDSSAATGLEGSDLPTYGAVLTRQPPFRFQLGARYSY